MPHTGDINFYGLHKVTQAEILHETGVAPGGRLPPSKGDLQDKLEQMSNVVQARIEAVCCEADRAALFIGIEERGAPHPSFRSDPSGDATLPQEMLDRYQQYLGALQRATAHGNTAEDLSAGHPLMEDPAARAIQTEFIQFAKDHLDELRRALHNSSDPDTRAAAAAVIGYGPKTQMVVDELQFALNDPELPVRTSAMRSLEALIVYAQKNADAGLKVAPTWLVELLHSVELRDRVEATKALSLMTDGTTSPMRAPAIDLMRERAVADLAEMARWPTLQYALPPFLLVGRIAGMPDNEITQAWGKSDRAAVITRALDTATSKSRGTRK
jgi:hypothetical protein